MRKIFAFAVICSIAASSISGIPKAYAETVEITCNVDGQSGVSNVGENATPLVTVNFGEAVDEKTLDSSTVKIYKGDEQIDYTPYSVSSESYEIDLKNFSSLEKNNANPQSYDPSVSENCRIELSGVKLPDGTDAGDKSFEFSTSLVLPVSYIEGYTIDNVALEREVMELGNGVSDSADKPEYATDGRQFDEWKVFRENVAAGNAAFKIDLEKSYKIAGVAVAGVNGGWYDRYQFIGGSDNGDITSGADMTKLVTGTINTAKWNEIVSAFFDYDEASRFRYMYAGSNTTCLACREFYVWAYIPDLVDSTIPVNGAQNVANVGNNAITDVEINFFDEMDESTLTPENIVITDSDGNELSYDQYTADAYSYKIPITVFKQNRSYTVTVTGNVLKADGTGDREYKLNFSTGAISMGSKPIAEFISGTYPENGDENITGETEEYIKIEFATNMEQSTLTGESIKLYDKEKNQIAYKGAFYENNTYKIPISILESDTEYTVKISGVVTEEGYESDGEYEFSFKTGTVTGTVDISDLFAGSTLDDNSDSVTNVGESAFINVSFNKNVVPDSLKSAVAVIDKTGNRVNGLKYSVSAKSCSIDKSGLESDTEYTLVIYKDNVAIPGITIIGDNIEIPFKTAYIFAEEAKVGTKIFNTAIGKTVYSANDGNAAAIVDGNTDNCYEIKGDTLLIDLGGYYEVLAIKHIPTTYFNYENGALPWHTNGINFWVGNNKDFTLKEFTNIYTTTAGGNPILMPVAKETRYARYIGITNPSKAAVIGEIEIYVRIGVGFGELSGNISGDECNVNQTILNYSESQKTAYMMFCEYDSSDRMVAVNAQEITLDKEKNDIKKTQKLNANTNKVKVFVSTDVNAIDMQTDALVMSR